MKRIRAMAVAAGLLGATGCVMGINENVVRLQAMPAFDRYDGIRTVAVVPFGDYWVTRGEKVVMGVPQKITVDNGKILCDIITGELKTRVNYKIVPADKVATVFKRRKEKVWGLLPPNEIQRVGGILRVDALIMGQIEDMSIYRYRTHNNSRVAAQIRMVDSATADPFWLGSFKVDEPGKPHEVARRAVRLLLDQLLSKQEASKANKEQPLQILDR
ncbi:MAG: hypothetical protein NT045_01270 [Candidatus Aureabacteria bacterium]|nr:hypothetical protein [Candidatus Auribacterota bacterium]